MKAPKHSILSRKNNFTLFFPFIFVNGIAFTNLWWKTVLHNKTNAIQMRLKKKKKFYEVDQSITFFLYIQIALLLWLEVLQSIMDKNVEIYSYAKKDYGKCWKNEAC